MFGRPVPATPPVSGRRRRRRGSSGVPLDLERHSLDLEHELEASATADVRRRRMLDTVARWRSISPTSASARALVPTTTLAPALVPAAAPVLARPRCGGLSAAEVESALVTLDTDVAELDLSHNSLSSIPRGLPQKVRLCVLQLAGNRLTSLAALSTLPHLERIDVSGNLLTSLAGLYGSAGSLHTVAAARNKLGSIDGLETMRRLAKLDVSHNALAHLASIRALSCNVNLRELRLAGNPVGSHPAIRPRVMALNPALLALDGARLSNSPAVLQADVDHDVCNKMNWTYASIFAARQGKQPSLEPQHHHQHQHDHEHHPRHRQDNPEAVGVVAHRMPASYDSLVAVIADDTAFDDAFAQPAGRRAVDRLRSEGTRFATHASPVPQTMLLDTPVPAPIPAPIPALVPAPVPAPNNVFDDDDDDVAQHIRRLIQRKKTARATLQRQLRRAIHHDLSS